MSGSVNKVILVGNCTRDPEIRSTQSGSRLANMTVATNESWTDKQTGERKDKPEYHRVVIFDERLVEVAEKYLRKGSKVYLEGQIQTRQWQDKDGATRYSTEVVLQRFRSVLTMLDSKPQDEQADEQQGTRAPDGYTPPEGRGGGDLNDEIPFAPCR